MAGLCLLAWATATSAGCDISSQAPSVKVQLPGTDGQPGPQFSLSSCAPYDIVPADRACSIDSNGKAYASDYLPTLPAAPPYAGYFHFPTGLVPLAQDLDSTSDDPAIRVLAAPASPTMPCCTDPSVTIRPPVQATLTPEGGLLVTIGDALPVGDELRLVLIFRQLYKSQLNPCVLPSSAFCEHAADTSFGVGFYVGVGLGSPRPDAGPPPAGACLLEYNSALATGDACCYRQGGVNHCDQAIACNAAAGPGCCQIYGTDNTAGGSRCCRYASGNLVDGADECRALLAQSR